MNCRIEVIDMKKGLKIFMLAIPIAIIVFFLAVLCYEKVSFWKEFWSVKKYHDVDIYKNKEYFNEKYFRSSDVTEKVAPYIDKFLIPYEKINFQYKDIQCYVFDGTKSSSDTGISIAVDFYLGDNYSQVKEQFMGKYAFYEEDCYKLKTDNFECLMVKDDEITQYLSRFGLICFNDKEGIVRQFYFYEPDCDKYEYSLEEYYHKFIKFCSNCPW